MNSALRSVVESWEGRNTLGKTIMAAEGVLGLVLMKYLIYMGEATAAGYEDQAATFIPTATAIGMAAGVTYALDRVTRRRTRTATRSEPNGLSNRQ